MISCHICGDGPAQGVTVYRQNPKGEPGVWACIIHAEQPVEPDVARIVTAIEQDNRDKRKP